VKTTITYEQRTPIKKNKKIRNSAIKIASIAETIKEKLKIIFPFRINEIQPATNTINRKPPKQIPLMLRK
jgi:hypothetical protein